MLFVIGKSLIGMYLGSSTIGSSYGAAGGIIIMLLWIYYSVMIFLLGAEFTKSFALRHGSKNVQGAVHPPEVDRPIGATAALTPAAVALAVGSLLLGLKLRRMFLHWQLQSQRAAVRRLPPPLPAPLPAPRIVVKETASHAFRRKLKEHLASAIPTQRSR
jgi:hypothetical protein